MSTVAIGKTLSSSWDLFKKRWQDVYLLLGVWVLASAVAQVATGILPPIGWIVSAVVGLIIEMALIKHMISLSADKKLDLQTSLEPSQPWQNILRFFWGRLVVGFVVVLGFLLFIVPGIIWAIKYMFVPALLIDTDLSVSDAMAKSNQMTKGKKWDLFLFGLVMSLLNLAGAMLLLIGLVVTMPVSMLAYFKLYHQLKAD